MIAEKRQLFFSVLSTDCCASSKQCTCTVHILYTHCTCTVHAFQLTAMHAEVQGGSPGPTQKRKLFFLFFQLTAMHAEVQGGSPGFTQEGLAPRGGIQV